MSNSSRLDANAKVLATLAHTAKEISDKLAGKCVCVYICVCVCVRVRVCVHGMIFNSTVFFLVFVNVLLLYYCMVIVMYVCVCVYICV